MGSYLRGRRRALVVFLLLAAAAIPATGSATSNSLPPNQLPMAATFGSVHMVGFQQYGTQPTTAADFSRIASMDDMVVAQPLVMSKIGPTLKADNPNITLLVYENAMYSGSNDPASMPESWYLHTSGGKRIVSTTGGGTMMNPRSTAPFTDANGTYNGWADYLAHSCARHQTSITSGCYLDMLGPGGIRPTYNVGGAVPIDPNTGQVFDPAAYEAMTGSIADITRGALPAGTTVIGNGYLNGHAYYLRSSATLNNFTDSSQAQGWMTHVASQISVPQWQRTVQMVIDNGAAGSSMIVHGECGCTTDTEIDATRQFDLATYLLANTGHAFFDFTSGTYPDIHAWQHWSPLYGLNLGTPTQTLPTVGGYFVDGVYQRGYTGGLVLVNPGTAAVTVPLNQTYHTLAGAAVTSVRVGAHSAQILTN
jgi:putative glycosyl hydrolase-like family 15 (GHL15) protein